MSEELRMQVKEQFEQKTIYEQLEIWRKNDRTEWSDEAFEVLGNILTIKLGELPDQNEPITDADENIYSLEEWEEKLLNEKDQPSFYEPLHVLDLRDKINLAAKAAIIVSTLDALADNSIALSLFTGMDISSLGFGDIGISIFISAIRFCTQVIPIYFPLIALEHILRILMEMEFNSRKTNDVK